MQRIIEKPNKVVITDRMWARLLSSTNQPSFMNPPKAAIVGGKQTVIMPSKSSVEETSENKECSTLISPSILENLVTDQHSLVNGST